MRKTSARRVVHNEAAIVPSPSGLPTRYLIDASIGSRDLFVAEQVLAPGDRVLLHTHPIEEVLVFLGGTGVATLGDEEVTVQTGMSLMLPAGEPHRFRNNGTVPLHVLVIFPGATFAATTLLEAGSGLADSDQLA